MPGATTNLVYECDPWEIDLGRRELRSNGTPVVLGHRAFEIVEALAQAGGELVTKDDLMGRIWPGAIVGDNTLHVHMSAVRKALGPDRGMLKTSSGRGYRLLGNWTVRHGGASEVPPPLPPPRDQPEARPPTNFPLTIAKLIGRTTAAQRVRDLVSAYRVVTLTGAGGIGKTALAMKVGRRLLADFEHGGWLVELASLSDAALAPSAVAGALGLKLVGEQTTAKSLARAVGDRHLLLVLDNCEHLIDAVATLVETMMQLCPRASVLATSREVCGFRARPSTAFRHSTSPLRGKRHPITSSAAALPSCSSPGRRHWTRASRHSQGISRLSPRSAGSSTAFRSPSSSLRPAPRSWEPSRSPPVCAIALRC